MHPMVAHCDSTGQVVAWRSRVNILGTAVGNLVGHADPLYAKGAGAIRQTIWGLP
jgi:hypothetical protein